MTHTRTSTATSPFAQRLVNWQRIYGRHDLPWQGQDAFGTWVSEIMLQQTQVGTVIPYYQRFLAAYPDVASLAAAPLDDVLALWAGLGYYRRARQLHAAAQMVMRDFGGRFPNNQADLQHLPGIGRTTAAAIAAFVARERVAILDGNVKRVLARWAGIQGFPGERQVEQKMWRLADTLLPPADDMPAYTQGLMDLGATLCTRSKPNCLACPLSEDCVAHLLDRTAELPTRKPGKTTPQRTTCMLLLECEGNILLQKRPPTGIWGGLWSLPEIHSEAEALDYCTHKLALNVNASQSLSPLQHTFTHFRLNITPLHCYVSANPNLVMESNCRWFTIADALGSGIPAPVRTLIEQHIPSTVTKEI